MIPWKTAAPALALLAALAACAHPLPVAEVPAPEPADQLQPMVTALDSGQYAGATEELLAITRAEPNTSVGRAAQLLAAAAEVDPRNPNRQLSRGANLLGSYLRGAPDGDWTAPVVASFYLLTQELGAGGQAAADTTHPEVLRPGERGLPRLPGPPLTARVVDLQRERDRLTARVKELEGVSADLRKQLADTLQELRRIRQTVRP
jgi:hypothetical protein